MGGATPLALANGVALANGAALASGAALKDAADVPKVAEAIFPAAHAVHPVLAAAPQGAVGVTGVGRATPLALANGVVLKDAAAVPKAAVVIFPAADPVHLAVGATRAGRVSVALKSEARTTGSVLLIVGVLVINRRRVASGRPVPVAVLPRAARLVARRATVVRDPAVSRLRRSARHSKFSSPLMLAEDARVAILAES